MFAYRSTFNLNSLRNAPLRRNFIPKFLIPGIAKKKDDQTSQRQLKKWRNDPLNTGEAVGSILSMMNRQANRKEFPLFIGRGSMPTSSDFKVWWDNHYFDSLDEDQRFQPERHQTLGNDLAVAHFVVARKGKVRKLGSEKFIEVQDILNLPSTFVDNWYVEEIDFSDLEVSYKGLINFRGLTRLKKMTFKNCPYFDDWCLERIVALCPTLEYLDISECEKVTERGLEGIYKAWELKELVVTDYYQNPSFELTCLMLEDCMPGLKVKRLGPPNIKSNDQHTDVSFRY